MGNRDRLSPIMLIMLVWPLLRHAGPPLLGPLALLITAGSEADGIGCVAQIRARPDAGLVERGRPAW